MFRTWTYNFFTKRSAHTWLQKESSQTTFCSAITVCLILPLTLSESGNCSSLDTSLANHHGALSTQQPLCCLTVAVIVWPQPVWTQASYLFTISHKTVWKRGYKRSFSSNRLPLTNYTSSFHLTLAWFGSFLTLSLLKLSRGLHMRTIHYLPTKWHILL